MKKAMILCNPYSGQEEALDYVGRLVNILLPGYPQLDIRVTQDEGDATRFSREASKESYDALFIMGGDGTVHEGVQGVAEQEHRPLLGVLPLGTMNNFARMLGFSGNADQALERYQKGVTLKTVDLGKLGEQYFITSVSIGSIPQQLAEVKGEDKSQSGLLAYFKSGLHEVLAEEKTHNYRLIIDGDALEEDFSLVLIALGNSIAGIPTFFANNDLASGKLAWAGLKATSLWDKMTLLPQVFRDQAFASDYVLSGQGEHIRIESPDPEAKDFTSNVDGDEGQSLPIDCSVLPAHLCFFVPDEDKL